MEVPMVLFKDMQDMHGSFREGRRSGFECSGEEIGRDRKGVGRWEVGGLGGEGAEGVEEW